MIVLIDNYDSFTYNVVQMIGMLGHETKVVRNDAYSVDELLSWEPKHLIFSPGPGRPEDAGICVELLKKLPKEVRFLGICLGHQALVVSQGGEIVQAERRLHGKTSKIYHDNKEIYQGLGNPFVATRYHSLIAPEESLPDCLEVSSWTSEGEVMGVRHKECRWEGVQFHPESILSQEGVHLMRNFLA